MIPFYACQAHGGKLLSLDDDAALTDLADINGAGGSTFQPKFTTSRFELPPQTSYWRLRRLGLHVAHGGTASIVTRVIRDGAPETATVTRNLLATDPPPVVVPLAAGASAFQLELTVTAFSAFVHFGQSMLFPVARRSQR